MTRTVRFWIVYAVLAVAALAFAVSHFGAAFPIVTLDLRMDRAHALAAARMWCARLDLGPTGDVREAASFGVDDSVKTFVELEGGGSAAFRAMLAEHRYEAYTWRVRRFRPGETREVLVTLTPQGHFNGVRERVPEDAPGPALPADSARTLAEHAVLSLLGTNIGPDFVSASSVRQRNGRVDHTFDYRRPDPGPAGSAYRLRAVVSGDRLTELTPSLHVPEAFGRRYQNLRAANDAIAFGATAAFVVLYLIGGIVGLFLLMRSGRVAWGPAALVGFAIAGVNALLTFNQWPLAWMDYETARSATSFGLHQVELAVLAFLADGCLVAISLAAAESLGRLAFPHHPQLWRAAAPEAAASRAIAGRVVGGTLLTGIEFGYVIAFYLLVTRLWHWWTPSESLVDPDVLATYVPWASAVAPSLHAGIWEEATFRAIPLAGAALLGDRFGKRGVWIGAALIVEALVFGGAHANYPSEPAFARPAELFLPALVWGLVYLRFGLVPSIVTHYLFDLSLFALPLFTSSAAAQRVDQIMIVVCAAAPLAWVAVAALRRRGLAELPATFRNAAWTPPPEPDEPEPAVPAPHVPAARAAQVALADTASARRARRILLPLGILGLAVWATSGSFTLDAPSLRVGRARALAVGADALRARGYAPAARWRTFALPGEGDADDENGMLFVWRELGRETYRALVGRDLAPPGWHVRIASWTGTVAERAEEWSAQLDGRGVARRLVHTLPEGRAGATLDEPAARAIAERELRDRLAVDPRRLRPVSATSNRLPGRTDWNFTWADTTAPVLAKGERRIAVAIAGDQPVDARRFVFVPETWKRALDRVEDEIRLLEVVRRLALGILLAVAAALGIVAWTKRRFPVRLAVGLFAIAVTIQLAGAILAWPRVLAAVPTTAPLSLVTGVLVVAMLILHPITAALFALVAGWCAVRSAGARHGHGVDGVCIGALAAGALAAASRLGGAPPAPQLGSADAAGALVPWLAEALGSGSQFMVRTAVLLALLTVVHAIAPPGAKRRPLALGALFVLGGLAVGGGAAANVGGWLAAAALGGAGLVALEAAFLGASPALAIGMSAALSILGDVRGLVRDAYPGANAGRALGIVLVAVLAWWWWRAARGRASVAGAAAAAD